MKRLALVALTGILTFSGLAMADSVPRISHLYAVESGPYSHADELELEWTDNSAVTSVTIRTGGITSHWGRIQGYDRAEPGPGTYRACVTPGGGQTHCIDVEVP